jgi:hypothetical protein
MDTFTERQPDPVEPQLELDPDLDAEPDQTPTRKVTLPAANDPRWKRVDVPADGFVSWKNFMPGDTVACGQWMGTHVHAWRSGRDSELGTIMTVDGEPVRFTMAADLARRLEHVPIGTYVLIIYKGIEKLGGGKERHLFDVRVIDPEDVPGLDEDNEAPF